MPSARQFTLKVHRRNTVPRVPLQLNGYPHSSVLSLPTAHPHHHPPEMHTNYLRVFFRECHMYDQLRLANLNMH